MLVISSHDQKEQNLKEIKEIVSDNGGRLMIFGGGVYAKIVSGYLMEHGVDAEIRCVLDDPYVTEEQKNSGVIAFSEYLKEYANEVPLIFGVYDYRIIQKKREQYVNEIPYMYEFHFAVVNNERIDWNREYIEEHWEQFRETYEMLSSEGSRDAMQAYLNAAVADGFHKLFTDFRDEVPYFSNHLSGCKIDRLFDCGAYDGDSAHDFIDAYPEYDRIYEFEPDCSNIRKIEERVVNENIRDLTIVDKGVWSDTTTLCFQAEGKSSSSISDEGEMRIDVIKLDDMYDQFTSNSLIKMDIEGSELEALKGAANVIMDISPSLAICVYHKREDLITIPQFISSLVGTGVYDYHIGYQGLDLAELVFYAVAKKNDGRKQDYE